ncbi:DNA polymerase-3 subunit epsilon [Blastomonas natatoria]|uniref:DNA polymerase III subunit epsilon n=1 Tax=Blastomonas natatoria TaxID=34015 RepID=A0A2V3V658_9SPHN|nr:DNA polymerase III subunit epsilon [Blastomonas natatoria]PXW76381.1 DNA polymerase-3 subunit epsilon [Blastomonas natatoria]
MREIIFDTETTGLSPDEGHRMVEIGCIEMVGRSLTGRTFHAYFNPEIPMPPEAEKVHGLGDAFLADKPLFAAGVDDLLEFLGEATLVAHNAGFDMRFLNAELAMVGRPAIAMNRVIDTVAMARAKFPGSPASLDALCKRFGVDRSHRVLHGALLDAELLAQVYIELTGGRQIGLGLADDSADAASGPATRPRLIPSVQRPHRLPRPFAASQEELAAHAAFLDRIKQPLWRSTR